MAKLALYAHLKPKPGKEAEVEALLRKGAEMAKDEKGTVHWYGFKEGTEGYGIFDTFETEEGREAHLNGPIAAALMAQADDLLLEKPQIFKINIVAEMTGD